MTSSNDIHQISVDMIYIKFYVVKTCHGDSWLTRSPATMEDSATVTCTLTLANVVPLT